MAKVKDLYVLGQWVYFYFHILFLLSHSLPLSLSLASYCSSLCSLSLEICCFFIIILIKLRYFGVLYVLFAFFLWPFCVRFVLFAPWPFVFGKCYIFLRLRVWKFQMISENKSKMFIRYGEFVVNLSDFGSTNKINGFLNLKWREKEAILFVTRTFIWISKCFGIETRYDI